MAQLDISFEGFWQCRLATDPDPSDEQKGISGFTYSIAGESLLEPSIWCQAKDILETYGPKEKAFVDPLATNNGKEIKNIREASPDYSVYNEKGIGIKVSSVKLDGVDYPQLSKLVNGLVRFEGRKEQTNWPWKRAIFEGRNQITSDGDPDRFTINPFVFSIADSQDNPVLKRFDPLDMEDVNKQLWEINPKLDRFDEILDRRLPKQRFALSNELLGQVGIDPTKLSNHFTNRANWLKSKILEAQANNQLALAESFKSRLFGVNFFTQSTGPTVLENRLLSRIPLRQLYHHSIRGTSSMEPPTLVNTDFFKGLQVDVNNDWDILYYMGAYDGDLMCGWCSGTLSIPVTPQ